MTEVQLIHPELDFYSVAITRETVTNHSWLAMEGNPTLTPPLNSREFFLFARVSIRFTYFTCASACIKMNSHFLAKALWSLAKFS